MENNQLQQNTQNNKDVTPQFATLELRLAKVENENRKLRQLFDSLFGGSNETRLYLKRQIVIDPQAIVGFFGKDPVKQASAIADASGGATVDTQARSALNSLLATLRTYGIIKT